MQVYVIWLIGVVVWNYGVPEATPFEDVMVAIILSFVSFSLKEYVFEKKNLDVE